MTSNKKPLDTERLDRVVSDIQRDWKQTYRERALKLFPWICASCGREFSGKRIRELTVHHKDHNHDNNPPDGSNWELLCLYCHDNEHSRNRDEAAYGGVTPGEKGESSTYKPFADLASILKTRKEE